jgi:hypothetical protein
VLAGGLAILVNRFLPVLWFRLRLRKRSQWASEKGFQRCASGAVTLDDVVLPLFRARGGKILCCFSRGRVTVIDYTYVQTMDGGPTERVDVRRAVTGVLVQLTGDAPLVTVRPRIAGAPRWILEQFGRFATRQGSMIDRVFATIETSDPIFDFTFQVIGDEQTRVRSFLTLALRQVMLANAKLTYEIGRKHAIAYASRLTSNDELEGTIALAERLADATRQTTG